MSASSPFPDVTGVILAGGRSRRMGGADKARLEVGGRRLVDRVADVLQRLFDRVLIAGDRPELVRPGLSCVPDVFPGSALGGLHTGLAAADTPYVFVAACDMPYIDAEVIRAVLRQRRCCDAVVPRTPLGVEPLFAAYSRSCLPAMEQMLRSGDYRIKNLFTQVQTCFLAAEQLPGDWRRTLLNINTPDQLRDMDP
ncbi:MAG: molybdenum cofactor guanylyltransferase [Desulfuromonadales bacterium]|nr:molybdenum cofactor guanylyltransferase [Desulfuromonadales bacterium]NIR32956.1 molybdenum cofactor guanylyltransferase [Desulfuromonadales bacterium]NIS40514.1 molybdenum cofactor guanylyltransferase [Desulfuromonadales bacterium]